MEFRFRVKFLLVLCLGGRERKEGRKEGRRSAGVDTDTGDTPQGRRETEEEESDHHLCKTPLRKASEVTCLEWVLGSSGNWEGRWRCVCVGGGSSLLGELKLGLGSLSSSLGR